MCEAMTPTKGCVLIVYANHPFFRIHPRLSPTHGTIETIGRLLPSTGPLPFGGQEIYTIRQYDGGRLVLFVTTHHSKHKQAMRSLLKSGDTQRIVVFANTARSKDIYTMAGNYLQTTNWKDSPDTIKDIVACYTKAGATQSLARFYDACAQVRTFTARVVPNCNLCNQVEIDDYRDYEKAASALQEAIKSVAKGNQDTMSVENAEIQTRINRKLTFIKKFLNIRM
jgi:hypothetical protein